nr:fused MFS/spermidine synthase [Nannocystis pusilla]
MLYLDGLRDLDDRDLGTLNHYLARAPAGLVRPARALLVGNGTLSMVPELSAMSDHLTTVEIDPAVVDAGARFFTPGEPLARLPNWRLVLADGKQFLAATDQRFDLIAVDLPSPLTLGEAYLHTREFYALCRARLSPGGVLAVQLSGRLGAPTRTPARLVASLRAEFPAVVVVDSESAERAFAYASDALPFTLDALRAAAAPGERALQIVAGEALERKISGAAPLTLDDLDLVLRRGAERLRERYF